MSDFNFGLIIGGLIVGFSITVFLLWYEMHKVERIAKVADMQKRKSKRRQKMREMDDFEKNESIDDLIDIFGQAIDEMLVENEVRMQITLPEGSMDPEIKSTFSKTGPVLDFYILLHALKKVASDFLDMDIIDPDKEEDMIDGMLQMVKDAIFEERQQDED